MLVVDDNADAADSLAEVVRSMGHHAEVAYSGLTALQIAADGSFDLVMLDIGLPEIDGYEVARRLRRLVGPATRIVAVTGYGAEEDRRRSREAGFDEHVVKPMMPETLFRILAQLQAPAPHGAPA
jgi:CheY-like chemotaxis protein